MKEEDKKTEFIDVQTKDVPLKEKLFIGDLDKYYKFGKFPHLFIVHIFLVIFTSLIVFTDN
jgi:hypothetical protein